MIWEVVSEGTNCLTDRVARVATERFLAFYHVRFKDLQKTFEFHVIHIIG